MENTYKTKKNISGNIKFQIKISRNIWILILCFFIIAFNSSCNFKDSNCFDINNISVPGEDEIAGVVFIYYEVNNSLSKNIKGELIVRNTFESNIKSVEIWNNGELVESNSITKVKEKDNSTFIVYGTSRFLTYDTLKIRGILKNENLIITLKDESRYELQYCN